MKLYKGFDKDLKCRDFQFEVGKTYEEKTASLCNSGFHACEIPIDCLGYYAPGTSVYHEVELESVTDEKRDDSKRVGTKITIGGKLKVLDIINATFEYVKENCTNNEVGGDRSALNGGYSSALNGGGSSALNGGDSSALNGGNWSALNGGYSSALNGGDRSALNGGYSSALNGGNRSALNGGNSSALNGGYSSALNGGNWSALNGGNSSALNGGYRSALNSGYRSVIRGGENSIVKGGLYSVLAIEYWKDNEFVKISFAEVDGEKIKADTWYTLNKSGKFVEVVE